MGLSIDGVDRVQRMLQAKAAQYKPGAVVVTGYACPYAVYTHENLQMRWDGLPRGVGLTRDRSGVVRVPASVLTGKLAGLFRGFYWHRPDGSEGKPRFLSDPFLRLRRELVGVIVAALRLRQTAGDAMFAAGVVLQVASQQEVPIDTGRLHNSAFTRRER